MCGSPRSMEVMQRGFVHLMTFSICLGSFVAARILDDRDGAVQPVETKVMIDPHAFPCLNVVQDKAFLNFTYV